MSNPILSARAGQMVVGYRFALGAAGKDFKLRSGTGPSVVIDQPVISGPIYLFEICFDDGGNRLLRSFFYVKCKGCSDESRRYKTRSIHMASWAYSHRCKRRHDASLGPSDGV